MPAIKRKTKCPICGGAPEPKHAPFCSRGCKDRDLVKWLGDGYRVPGPPADPEAFAAATNGVDSES